MTPWRRALATGFACWTFAGAAFSALGSVNPVAFDFGEVTLGRAAFQDVRFQNLSGGPVSVFVSDAGSTTFRASTNCPSEVPADTGCTIFIDFRPFERGSFDAEARISVFADQRQEIYTVALTGTGVGQLAEVFPTTIDFGSSKQGEGVTVPVTIRNTHRREISFPGPSKGLVPIAFSSISNCPSILQEGEECTIDFRFEPQSPGEHEVEGVITLQSGTTTDTIPYRLTGRADGQISQLRIARVWPVTIGFGALRRGSEAEVFVTYENRSTGALTNFAGGGIGAPFASGSLGCGAGVPIGGSCQSVYRYTGDSTQRSVGRTSTSFSSTAGGSQTIEFELSGRAWGRLAQISPVQVDYGSVPLHESVSVPVEVLNTSDSPLQAFTASVPDEPFFVTSSTCDADVDLGEVCTYEFSFLPAEAGMFSDGIIVGFTNDSGLSEIVPVQLQGRGFEDLIFRDDFGSIF